VTAPAAPATAHVPTLGMSVELPAVGDPRDLAAALAEWWDLPAGDIRVAGGSEGGEPGALTVASDDLSRMLIMSVGPDVVRLRLLVTAPDAEARAALVDALDELAFWAARAGVDGWRWMADGCAGWHCAWHCDGGLSCLAPPAVPVAPVRRVARWRRVVGRVFAELGTASAYGTAAVVALYVVARWAGEHRPSAGADLLSHGIYDLGDPTRSVPIALAAYAAGRLLLVAAALLDPPRGGRLAEVRDAAGPVVLAAAGALLGWGWLA
jgi:hypothetical protein